MPHDTNNLQPGEVLTPGQYIRSNNQCYRMLVQRDGNVVLYFMYDGEVPVPAHPGEPIPRKEVVVRWASNTQGTNVRDLKMQTDGNLVLYSQAGIAKWASNTDGNYGAVLELEEDGDLTIRVNPRGVLWQRPRP